MIFTFLRRRSAFTQYSVLSTQYSVLSTCLSLALLGTPAVAAPADNSITISFDKVETGKPMPNYTDQGVVFALAHPPARSRAAGRVIFFPHLKTERKGILNAMANEAIPVEVRFPKPVASVTLVLWGSIGSAALVEAYDGDGKVVGRASRERVPERTGPEQAVPSFELTVKASTIAYVRYSGAQSGGYLVCDEVRFTRPASSGSPGTWTADNGNGTYSNPCSLTNFPIPI